ncbi:chloride channel protein [Granulosicoccaceae sp. 1_MG-2023]|nr:chloride channel protein [Granulosicoccaceae sp. 1_MG-2023]
MNKRPVQKTVVRRLKPYYESNISQRGRFFALAALVGLLVGLATIGLIEMIGAVQRAFFGRASEADFASIVMQSPLWLVVLAPALGGLLVGLLLRFVHGKRYHGIADVIEACAVRGARMDVRSGVSAAVAAAVSLGSGAPVGREGPAVHIGASISAWIAGKLGFSQSDSLTLLGCGAAAAVTASFNAPIAGVLFALEVVVGYYTMRVFAPVVLASAASVIVRRSFYGSDQVFDFSSFTLSSHWELPVFGVVGISCALFVLALIFLVRWIQDMWAFTPVVNWLQPALAGVLIGTLGVWMPHAMGSGYQSIEMALHGQMLPLFLLSVLLTRTVATAMALGSGFAGGVFTPSLVFGALVGALIWALLNPLMPLSSQGAYAIVGMGALASAMLGAPISTVLIVFELTANYEVTIAVMLAAAMASTVMQLSPHTSYFRWQLSRRGVNITSGRDQSLLRTRTIESLVKQSYTKIADEDKIIDVQRQLSAERNRIAILTDAEDCFVGSANLRMLVAESIEHGFDTPARDVLGPANRCIGVQTNLVAALQEMAENDMDYMPVVEDRDELPSVLRGVVFRDDVLRSYYNVIRAARAEEFGVN